MNMYYCVKCKSVSDTDKCPACGSWQTRTPEADDICLLAERPYIQASMLAGFLDRKGIPYMVQSRSLKPQGPTMGIRAIYVSYDRLAEAQAAEVELFAADETVQPAGAVQDGDPAGVLSMPEPLSDSDIYGLEKMSREELKEYRNRLTATLREMKKREETIRDVMDEIDFMLEE